MQGEQSAIRRAVAAHQILNAVAIEIACRQCHWAGLRKISVAGIFGWDRGAVGKIYQRPAATFGLQRDGRFDFHLFTFSGSLPAAEALHRGKADR